MLTRPTECFQGKYYCNASGKSNVFARDSIHDKRANAIAIPSVRPSVLHTGGSVKKKAMLSQGNRASRAMPQLFFSV